MAKKQVSETLTSQNSETSKIENMENSVNVSETLTETQENANAAPDAVSKPLTFDDVENITHQIKSAKIELAELNAKFDYDETNVDIVAKEKQISDLLTERKSLEKQLEKLRLENLYNETLTNAKNDLYVKFGITPDYLAKLLEDAKNPEVKDTLIQSFNIVFGKKPLTIPEGLTGKSLAKQTVKAENANGFNITKNVKAMLTAEKSPEEIDSKLLANTDMDETKAKKRLNDVRWGWEIENGIREKPSKS